MFHQIEIFLQIGAGIGSKNQIVPQNVSNIQFSYFIFAPYFIELASVTLRKKYPNINFSGPYFPVFGLNMEVSEVNLRIRSKYGKIKTRETPFFDNLYAVVS